LDEQLRGVLAQVGMEAAAQVPCNHLSQGQQRRVAMARWLCSPAQVWLLDEPFTSLDVAGQALLNQILKQHCETDGTVICATHVPVDYAAKSVVQLEAAAHA
jgi:heme exporter protein A